MSDDLGSRFANPEIRWSPDSVVRPQDADDVRRSVGDAVRHGRRVAVRGGGVGFSGARPGSVLLDLRDLDDVVVDPGSRRVRVGGGAVWRDVSRILATSGFAGAAPQFPRLGVAGHALGGGHGWLSGKLGWASDTVRAVELVTADGELVRADVDHEPDLFWALRGAGSNFGVTVAIELEVMPLAEVAFGLVWFHPDESRQALAHFRDWVVAQPDEVTAIGSLAVPPPDWNGPARLAGRPAVHVIVCHCGTAEQAERDLADLRGHRAVVADSVRRMPWVDLACGNDVFTPGLHRRSRMYYLRAFDDAAVDLTVDRAEELGPLDMMSTHYYGGAIQRVAEEATAMSHRDKPWNYMVQVTWSEGDDGEARRRWHEGYLADVERLSHDAFYVNYLFDEPDHVPAAYSARTWRRLVALKQQWDPANTFADNQNIRA
ncbi:FAD-binding oxidoreductase [Nocardioides mangrovicus]|uniref:FAD-binding oxidoreductase n=1 Tax=Nocardioides mangrovicus TaxID=2478913 RepID=A0A3L8P4R8_9ACTN|nr:FAD-binding protein [Nocardioides mangrovicus]RLV49987.1 FAD-binding oxidoreductase [Nocardioides mangrovicus]